MFPNANISDIIATTIQNRSSKIADNVTSNNAVFSRLKKKGKIKT
ncbi:MAG: phage major capsid protein, partial [Afipia sp.]|nr:phage major capsid protein [Afipia sp.]